MTLLLDAKEKIPTHSLNDAVLGSKIYMTKVFRKSVPLSWYMLYNETYYLQKNAERRFTRQKALMTGRFGMKSLRLLIKMNTRN